MKRFNFNFNMARGNHVVLSCWLVLHAFWMPMLSSELMRRFPDMMGVVEYNIIYYLMSTLVVLFFGWHYLRRDFDTLMDNGFGTIVMLLRAFFINLALSFFAAQIIVMITGGDLNWLLGTGEAVGPELSDSEIYKITALTAFLGPVIEEVLFRGCVFGWMRDKNRLAAYVCSVGLYVLAHVWQYAIQSGMDSSTLLYAISYLPGAFVLAWCYDRTGSIWTGILFNIGTNLFGLNLFF